MTDENIEREIYTYTLITALAQQGRDTRDVFCPFVVSALPEDTFITTRELQDILARDVSAGMYIPADVLDLILRRAAEVGYVQSVGTPTGQHDPSDAQSRISAYKLTSKGSEYIRGIAEASGIKARMRELYNNVSLYLVNRHATKRTESEIDETIVQFIRKNLARLWPLVGRSQLPIDYVVPNAQHNERLLIEYLRFARTNAVEHYRTFREMVFGSVMSVLLYAPQETFASFSERKMKPCRVYLDTNFLFSALEMHSKEQSGGAIELLRLLRKHGFDIRVFNFTVHEARRVMRGYIEYLIFRQKGKPYPLRGTRFHLYEALAAAGWTQQQTRDFVVELPQVLKKQGFELDLVPVKKIQEIERHNTEIANLIAEKKRFQSIASRIHDLAGIVMVRTRRGGKVFRMEDARAFFLTSDRTLAELNYVDMKHKEDGTIGEVILDSLLAGILWMKNPGLEFPLEIIIAANSRDLIINEHIWEVFYNRLKGLYQAQQLSIEDISNLFYGGFIEDALSPFNETATDKVTDELIINLARTANQKVGLLLKEARQSLRKEMEVERADLERQLLEALQEKENIGNTIQFTAEETQQALIDGLAQKHAKIVTKILFVIENAVLLTIGVLLFLFRHLWIAVAVLVICVILAILKSENRCPWSTLKDWLASRAHAEAQEILQNPALSTDAGTPLGSCQVG